MNFLKGYLSVIGAVGLVLTGVAQIIEGNLDTGMRQIIEGLTLFGLRRAIGPIGR